ncbi:hypothetical protein Dsin_019408 [Dipteronia sinensis]|uniref:Uncharacterized protein n=1 Tax=Dipteronia sinensis TaxID=43782 RepID=A0AAE0E2H7_9ROSI|nr:hypothetical protein Dsin_019408 [Dipteronia sinensis]
MVFNSFNKKVDDGDTDDEFKSGMLFEEKHTSNQSLERQDIGEESVETKDGTSVPIRNFDLNVDLEENGDSMTIPVPDPAPDPIQLAHLSRRMDKEEEDYDNEER